MKHGPQALERLLRAILYHSPAPVVLTDDDRHFLDGSSCSSAILRQAPEALNLDGWQDVLAGGEPQGILHFVDVKGSERELEYAAQKDVLPQRHLIFFGEGGMQTSLQNYALSLVDAEGNIVAWYAGAERLFGYDSSESGGRHLSSFAPETNSSCKFNEILKRAASSGHAGTECWQHRRDGSRFWASTIAMPVKDERGILQGFACVVRDFSDRHERDERLRRGSGQRRELLIEAKIAGVVSGEFDRITEANGAFLEVIGYSREDLIAGGLRWCDLCSPESVALAEVANEDGMLHGACTPFQSQLIRKDGGRVPVLVTTAVLELAPFRWTALVQQLHERKQLEILDELADEVAVQGKRRFDEMVGVSKSIQKVMEQIELVAPTDATVLILGETGTGKELIARAIHRMSPRRSLPFVTLNCAAIPTGLLESELFGYERGAFTGALTQKIGRFEMANGGTLFLDEVGDISMELQPKLLRALQEKSFERLGGTKTIPIEVRLVAATNRDLEQMMRDNLFRSDLYYRLRVFPIHSPPLRERPEDIPLLVRHFTRKFAAKMKRTIETISSDTMDHFVAWPWPGNIRELENFIERSVIFSTGTELQAPVAELKSSADEIHNVLTLDEVERNHILTVLRKSKGSVSRSATILGLPRTTLNAIMKKLAISRADI